MDYLPKVVYKMCPENASHTLRAPWPLVHKMKESTALLKHNRPNGPLQGNIFAVVDGGRPPCATYIDPDIRDTYYKRYTQIVETINPLVYNFKREVIHAAMYYLSC